jgi:serine/threonine protein phosphatase PrpC
VSMKAAEVGVVSKQGKRASMEDSYCLTSFYVTPFGEEEPLQAHLAAVFDGHRYIHIVCINLCDSPTTSCT